MPENNEDKFKAIWLSHSSISDFIKCPRLYFLRNIYKNPANNHKMTIMTPQLALGQAVHEVIEYLSYLPTEKRFDKPLKIILDKAWRKISGFKGGFESSDQEKSYKDKAISMIGRITRNPGPISNKALKIKSENGLIYYWFSKKENIILCGKIDWIEYIESDNSIHIIDFKTGKFEEDESSLQLPIYLLLAKNTQKRKVSKLSYWYLNKENGLNQNKIPNLHQATEKVAKIADRIKLARQLEMFNCKLKGCRYCFPFERVLKGEGQLVGISEYGQDIYILKRSS